MTSTSAGAGEDSRPPVHHPSTVVREALPSERVAGGMLPRVLTTFDMVAIFIAIVLFITNAAVIQSAGPSAFGWWILGFALFLVPGAIVTGQLGRMFPGEGSIYLWTHKAFGRFWGFFAGFCAWWPGVLVMVTTGTVVLSYLGFVFPGSVGTWSVQMQGIAITGFIVLSGVLAAQRFRLTQNAVNVVVVLYVAAVAVVLLAGIVYLTSHPAVTDPTNWSAYRPSANTGINLTNWTFFGLVILALLGVEVPLNMGVEIKEQKAVTRYLLWGSLTVMLAYLTVTWAVMVSVPAANGQSASVVAVAQAAAIGLSSFWGKLVALILAAFFLFITVVYNYSFARLVFVSGIDRALPAAMGRVNRHQVPANAVRAQTVVAGVVTLLAFVALPGLGVGGGKSVDVQTRVYDVLQAAVTVIWCLSMVVLFVDVLIIVRRFAAQFHATRLAHPAVFWVSSVIGGLAALIGAISTLSGSWTPLISNNAGTIDIFGAKVSYGTWFWAVGGIAMLSLAVGALLYLTGYRRAGRAQTVTVPPPSAAS